MWSDHPARSAAGLAVLASRLVRIIMDAVHFTEACVRLARERGITTPWHRLSFDQRYSIIREIEATLPKPVPARPPIRELNGGASGGIGGGIGLPPGVEERGTTAAPSVEGGRGHHY